MDRRDFIKSGLLAAAVGAVGGTKAIAQEAERQAAREQLSKDILNYNPQMQYRPMGRTGVNVSALGFGMLRLPMKNGHVDFDQTTPMVRRAIEGGVNYIDTGRVYLGGESEQAVGKALAGGWRDRVYVTSKMPWWEMRSADDFEKFFDQSRRAIGTDVIDFYPPSAEGPCRSGTQCGCYPRGAARGDVSHRPVHRLSEGAECRGDGQ